MLFNLGQVAVDQGELERAVEYLTESADIARELGDEMMLAGSRALLGMAALEGGDHQRALSLLRDALALFHELEVWHDLACVLEALAHTAVAQGDARRALCLDGAAARLRETIRVKLTDQERRSHDSHMNEVRQGLSVEVAERAFADGYGMPLERAVEYALGMR